MTFPSFADFCKIFALFGKILDIVYFFFTFENEIMKEDLYGSSGYVRKARRANLTAGLP